MPLAGSQSPGMPAAGMPAAGMPAAGMPAAGNPVGGNQSPGAAWQRRAAQSNSSPELSRRDRAQSRPKLVPIRHKPVFGGVCRTAHADPSQESPRSHPFVTHRHKLRHRRGDEMRRESARPGHTFGGRLTAWSSRPRSTVGLPLRSLAQMTWAPRRRYGVACAAARHACASRRRVTRACGGSWSPSASAELAWQRRLPRSSRLPRSAFPPSLKPCRTSMHATSPATGDDCAYTDRPERRHNPARPELCRTSMHPTSPATGTTAPTRAALSHDTTPPSPSRAAPHLAGHRKRMNLRKPP
jgi:hypothetical protein